VRAILAALDIEMLDLFIAVRHLSEIPVIGKMQEFGL
jgi:hypothetical protein